MLKDRKRPIQKKIIKFKYVRAQYCIKNNVWAFFIDVYMFMFNIKSSQLNVKINYKK